MLNICNIRVGYNYVIYVIYCSGQTHIIFIIHPYFDFVNKKIKILDRSHIRGYDI